MKRIISILLPMLFVLVILAGCGAKTNETKSEPTSSAANNTAASQDTLVSQKELLKIQNFGEELEEDANASEPNVKQISIAYENLSELSRQKYEYSDELKAFVDYMDQELGIHPDDRWSVVVHFYDDEQTVGMVHFQYWIDSISTNKTVVFNLDNGKSDTVFYNCLDGTVDEENLIERVRLFEERYEQEKLEFHDGEKFISEDVTYSYFYNTDRLRYTYSVFFEFGEGTINNEFGTECYIDEDGYAFYLED